GRLGARGPWSPSGPPLPGGRHRGPADAGHGAQHPWRVARHPPGPARCPGDRGPVDQGGCPGPGFAPVLSGGASGRVRGMNVPDDLRYTSDHEWARLEDGRVRIGITDYAQDALGDVVFVKLPEPGAIVAAA